MMKRINKLFLSCCTLGLIPCLLTSCSPDVIEENSGKQELQSQLKFGKDTFIVDNSSDFEIFLFDNFDLIKADGKSTYDSFDGFLSPQDCYLIRVPGENGNATEILVDCGFAGGKQFDYGFNNVFLPKLCSIVKDGVLDYVIVTHGDSDHTIGFSRDNGYFDCLVKPMYNENILVAYSEDQKIKIPRIGTLIDYDSEIVSYYSSEEYKKKEYGEQWFYTPTSDHIVKYVKKRNQALTKPYYYSKDSDNPVMGISRYCPASAFFSKKTVEDANGIFFKMDEYLNYANQEAMPTQIKELKGEGLEPTRYSDNFDVSEIGQLKKASKDNDYAFVFEIDLGHGVYLRFLYQWFYNNIIKNAWRFDHSSKYGTKEGNSKNNICVCFEVVSEHAKFASFGDLGGAGAESLNLYYKNTDVLKNITCWKATHHGSNTNQEIKYLFNDYVPKLILIPAILIKQRDELLGNDPLFSHIAPVAYPKYNRNPDPSVPDSIMFFNKFIRDDVTLLAPNVIGTQEGTAYKQFKPKPLYGDIHVTFKGNDLSYCYSYGGIVDAYIDMTKPSLKFLTYIEKENKVLSIKDIQWYKTIYGGNKK